MIVTKSKKVGRACSICSPGEAEPGQYCEAHRETLHQLEHQYEPYFRLQRYSRGKDHEVLSLFFMPGDCEPAGRVLVTETDPDSLLITAIIAGDVDLEKRVPEYEKLGIEKTYGDLLRDRIQIEIVHSWYGAARACVDVFTTDNAAHPGHWDIDPRDGADDEERSHPPEGSKHSIH
jgi:hypothetical protein